MQTENKHSERKYTVLSVEAVSASYSNHHHFYWHYYFMNGKNTTLGCFTAGYRIFPTKYKVFNENVCIPMNSMDLELDIKF